MKFERYDQTNEKQKGVYLLPFIAFSYGILGTGIYFGWLHFIWILWLTKKETSTEKQ